MTMNTTMTMMMITFTIGGCNHEDVTANEYCINSTNNNHMVMLLLSMTLTLVRQGDYVVVCNGVMLETLSYCFSMRKVVFVLPSHWRAVHLPIKQSFSLETWGLWLWDGVAVSNQNARLRAQGNGHPRTCTSTAQASAARASAVKWPRSLQDLTFRAYGISFRIPYQ